MLTIVLDRVICICLFVRYVRMNRKRLKGEGGHDDCKQALLTLYNILFNIIKMMSPFSPFIAETMYQYLKQLTDANAESVHYLMLPQPNRQIIDETIERSVARMQSVIELGRVIRDRKTIPVKYPLPEVVVVHQDPQYISDVKTLEPYILSELNVRKLTTTTDKTTYGITLRAEPDHKTLGLRLKQDFKNVTAAIKNLTDAEINEIIKRGHALIAGHKIDLSEIRLIFKSDNLTTSKYEVHSDNDVVVLLDTTPDSSMQDEGTAREIINRVQKLRKKAHLVPTDEIKVYYESEGDLGRVADAYRSFVENTIKAPFETRDKQTTNEQIIIEETQLLKNCKLHLILTKQTSGVELPLVRWANIELLDLKPYYCNDSTRALILLETRNKKITLAQLKLEIKNLFGLQHDFKVLTRNGKLENDSSLDSLNGETLYVLALDGKDDGVPQGANGVPYCKIKNFVENGVKGTVVLENPKGVPTGAENDLKQLIARWVNGE